MAKAKKIEVEGKEYILAFPNRRSAENAEKLGFNLTLVDSQPLVQTNILFHASLLAKQENVSAQEADEIREKYQADGGDISEINSFLLKEYTGFFESPKGKKKMKKAETIEI